MKILILGFKGATFFEKYLKNEAESRGHSVDFCRASQLSAEISHEGIDLRANGVDMTTYDVVHVGAVSSNRWSVSCILGQLNKMTGCQIVDNRLIDAPLRDYSGLSKYFLENELNIALPRSLVFKRVKDIQDRISHFSFPVIIKTNKSKQGKGVGFAKNIKDVEEFVNGHLADDEKVGFVLREHIPNDGDYRVNVVDGKAVICLKKTPKKGEYRSNIALGGTLTNAGLEDTKEICQAAEKIATASGYDIAGVDVMTHKETGVPYILEVNRAPSGLEDDQEVSGVNLAAIIVDLYEQRVSSAKGYFSAFLEHFSKT